MMPDVDLMYFFQDSNRCLFAPSLLEENCSLVYSAPARPVEDDTSRPGGQESDFEDALWELLTTRTAAVVGQSCSSSLLMSCFCKRHTRELAPVHSFQS